MDPEDLFKFCLKLREGEEERGREGGMERAHRRATVCCALLAMSTKDAELGEEKQRALL